MPVHKKNLLVYPMWHPGKGVAELHCKKTFTYVRHTP